MTLPEPRPIAWPLRPLASAETGMIALPDGRLELTIRHAVLKSVTPEMLYWWYGNVEGSMNYMGRVYPRYLVWHPLDHVSYTVVRRAPDGSVDPGARVRIIEAFARNPAYRIDVEMEIFCLDRTGATVARRLFGQQVMILANTFVPLPEGTQVLTRFVIGLETLPLRRRLNAILTVRLFPVDKAKAWLKHNVEEVGTLEHFLPALFASQAGWTPEPDSTPMRSSHQSMVYSDLDRVKRATDTASG